MILHPQRPTRYRIKMERRAPNPDDPARQAMLRMRRLRQRAMRKAMETGEPYRDPFGHHPPFVVTSSEVGDPNDPARKAILHMRRVRQRAIRRAMERGERYRDPYHHVPPPELDEP